MTLFTESVQAALAMDDLAVLQTMCSAAGKPSNLAALALEAANAVRWRL